MLKLENCDHPTKSDDFAGTPMRPASLAWEEA
jgi:hypothetical protein